MSANSRLTLAVHALTWLARYRDRYAFATSERIAESININPVTLRGLLGMMEKQHLVNVAVVFAQHWSRCMQMLRMC